jgi:hypothetical protein
MRCLIIQAATLVALSASSAIAQTMDDGLSMPRKAASAGVLYSHDSWNEYWEGTLKRSNGNIGTLTTQSVVGMAGYGVTDRLGVMATLPYVWTHASQGVLHSMSGIQDLTVAAKYRLVTSGTSRGGSFSAFVVGAAALPMSNYSPDFMPLSIGSGGARASGRMMMSFQSASQWFANASAAYTFCNNVKLNRSAYYTNGQLYLTNEVAMPNVMEYTMSAGVQRGRLRIPVSLVEQQTLGGGDIRRQDMPFVSNRMNFAKIDGAIIYALPAPSALSLRLGAAHVLSGRNVGQSTTFTSGLVYGFHF